MQHRRLGNAGPMVSAVGLGAMSFAGVYGSAEDAESEATVARALELGVTFIDTANIYGVGHSEEVVGRAIAGRRADVVLATKFGGGGGTGLGRRDKVRPALEESLARLGTDYVDLYYLHRVDPVDADRGDRRRDGRPGLRRPGSLPRALRGRARRRSAAAHATHPITALQTEYSIFSREPEAAILPTTRELGIGFVAYSPLGRGMLTGQFQRLEDLPADDWRRSVPRWQEENFDRNVRLVSRLEEIARRHDISTAQLALAWVLHQGDDIVPDPRNTQARESRGQRRSRRRRPSATPRLARDRCQWRRRRRSPERAAAGVHGTRQRLKVARAPHRIMLIRVTLAERSAS